MIRTRILVLGVCLSAALALAQSWQEAQGTTRAAPTACSTEGISIATAKTVRVSLCASISDGGNSPDGGGTLTGSGMLLGYWRPGDSVDCRWRRMPSLDLSVPVASTDCAGSACVCAGWRDIEVGAQSGRYLWATSGVTVNWGADAGFVKAFASTAGAATDTSGRQGMRLDPTIRTEFTNCPAVGAVASQTVPAGKYEFRAKDEDVAICYGSACDAGTGEWYAAGTLKEQTFSRATELNCRSIAGTGDAIFTRSK